MLKMFSTVAVAAATSLVSLPAAAEFMDFQVSEGSVPGTPDNTFWADKLNGGYTEMVSLTSATTFSAQAYATFGQYMANEATVDVDSFVSTPDAAGGYRLYALFNATGTFSGTSFTGVTGQFTLYIDPDRNTTFSLTDGIVAPTLGGDGEDYEIGSTSTLVNGSGDLGGVPAAFDFIFTNFTLTDEGKAYFTSPSPFYIQTRVNGDIDADPALGNPFQVTGDVSAVFVPEPGTLALAGLALGAMGLVSRRRRSS